MRKVSAVGRDNQIMDREEGDFALERRGRIRVDSKYVRRVAYSDCVVHDDLELPWKRSGGRLSLNIRKSCKHA